jgi:hypothetical protein
VTAGRIKLRNPDRAKAMPTIDRSKDEIVRREILALVPKREPGITWTALRDGADERLGMMLGGSNNWWYTSVVKLHLEAIGEIERSGGAPQRLIRK